MKEFQVFFSNGERGLVTKLDPETKKQLSLYDKGKFYFPDHKFKDAAYGPALVHVSHETETYGFLDGRMIRYEDETPDVETVLDWVLVNRPDMIAKYDHPVRGIYYKVFMNGQIFRLVLETDGTVKTVPEDVLDPEARIDHKHWYDLFPRVMLEESEGWFETEPKPYESQIKRYEGKMILQNEGYSDIPDFEVEIPAGAFAVMDEMGFWRAMSLAAVQETYSLNSGEEIKEEDLLTLPLGKSLSVKSKKNLTKYLALEVNMDHPLDFLDDNDISHTIKADDHFVVAEINEDGSPDFHKVRVLFSGIFYEIYKSPDDPANEFGNDLFEELHSMYKEPQFFNALSRHSSQKSYLLGDVMRKGPDHWEAVKWEAVNEPNPCINNPHWDPHLKELIQLAYEGELLDFYQLSGCGAETRCGVIEDDNWIWLSDFTEEEARVLLNGITKMNLESDEAIKRLMRKKKLPVVKAF